MAKREKSKGMFIIILEKNNHKARNFVYGIKLKNNPVNEKESCNEWMERVTNRGLMKISLPRWRIS